MKRFARLTNGHSKKIDNHVAMVALYTTWYNFARINSAIRMSPAMACGLEQRLWDIGDIVKLVEDWEDGGRKGGLVQQETRLDVIERHIAEAKQAIERQKYLIAELERDGHPTKGSYILLGLLEDSLRLAQEGRAILKSRTQP